MFQKPNKLNYIPFLTQCFVHCVYEMGNMIRKGKVNFDQAVRQVKMFIPEEYKRAAFDSLEACRGSGKKIECD